MKTYFDCIPCFVRQALDSARLATSDEAIQQRVLRVALQTGAEMDLRQSPPAMAQQLHRAIREFCGQQDPYRQIKDWSNQLALTLYPDLKSRIDDADVPLEEAVKLAIAGNIIDFGLSSHLSEEQVHSSITHARSAPLTGDINLFASAISQAERILYLADNAGEIVFDRLLIERLPRGRVTVAVRGFPIINDATLADARMAHIDDIAELIENGSDAPGTILSDCSQTFRHRFESADLIISKGQGNYETLSDINQNICFLLKAKCPVVARDIGCQVGDIVLKQTNRSAAAKAK